MLQDEALRSRTPSSCFGGDFIALAYPGHAESKSAKDSKSAICLAIQLSSESLVGFHVVALSCRVVVHDFNVSQTQQGGILVGGAAQGDELRTPPENESREEIVASEEVEESSTEVCTLPVVGREDLQEESSVGAGNFLEASDVRQESAAASCASEEAEEEKEGSSAEFSAETPVLENLSNIATSTTTTTTTVAPTTTEIVVAPTTTAEVAESESEQAEPTTTLATDIAAATTTSAVVTTAPETAITETTVVPEEAVEAATTAEAAPEVATLPSLRGGNLTRFIHILAELLLSESSSTTTTTVAPPTEDRDYGPESPPYDPEESSSMRSHDPFALFSPLSPVSNDIEVEVETAEPSGIPSSSTLAPLRESSTTTTTTPAPVVKTEQEEPDWNDVHQQAADLHLRPYERRYGERLLETRVLLLDDDSENRLVGEDHEYGREIGAKREPDSEDEEELGINWEDAHEIPSEELAERQTFEVPEYLKDLGARIDLEEEEEKKEEEKRKMEEEEKKREEEEKEEEKEKERRKRRRREGRKRRERSFRSIGKIRF